MMNNTIKNETGTQGGTSLPMFSVFPCGCKNRAGEDVMAKSPCGTMNLTQVYEYIKQHNLYNCPKLRRFFRIYVCRKPA